MKKDITLNLPRNEVVIKEGNFETTTPLGDDALRDLTDNQIKQLIKARLQTTGVTEIAVQR